jgi:very-short-patch-repair endonuclease
VARYGEIPCKTGHTPVDRAIAELAARQHGTVSLVQLKRLGLSHRAINDRVAAGRLHRIHRGVYAVGHPRLTARGRWLAAVLACGPGAALSHRSAAALRGLRQSDGPQIDVTSPRRAGRRHAGITVHSGKTLAEQDVATADGIPCTSTSRTLLDLAEVVDRRGLERAFERAETLRLFDLRRIEDVLDRAHGRRGAATLRAVLADHGWWQRPTRQELERRFLELCLTARLEPPRVNMLVEGLEVDFSWPAHRLIVETDGFATHGTRRAFERDRERDRLLLLAGWRVVRFTWRQVTDKPAVVASTVRSLLTRDATPEPDLRAWKHSVLDFRA